MESIIVRPIALDFAPERLELEAFLAAHHLNLEADVEKAFGLYDAEDTLQGCGCAAGRVLKCFAIDDSLRGQNGLGLLISHLNNDRFAAGFDHLFVMTRPHNRELFEGCGFFPVAQTETVLLLENRRRGIQRFLEHLPKAPQDAKRIGALVMNCNPFTLGHQSLIYHASRQCDWLYVFVVEEDRSVFPFAHRIDLVRQGVADLPNVCVCPSGPYMISAMTFPTYFLKETEDPSVVQSELDLTVFGTHIAPALGITVRFAGTEPLDAVTKIYNETMASLLPRFGVAFCEVERVHAGGEVISASRVRALLKDGDWAEVQTLVPETTAAYLMDRFGGNIS